MSMCDARPLCAFRAAFGALMLVHIWRLHHHGMYERSVLLPAVHFPYRIFGVELQPLPWLPPRTARDASVHLLLMSSSAVGIAVGFGTRACAVAFALSYSGFVLCERTMFNNHYYLYVLLALLVALVKADQTYSLRAWAARRKRTGSIPAATAANWHRDLLRLQVCIVYFFAGVAKLNEDWLWHSQPMATKLIEEAATQSSWLQPLLEPLLLMPETAAFVSLTGVAFDLLIAPLLVWPLTRPAALLLASAFHLSNHFLWSLGEFPWVMLATNLLFLDALPFHPPFAASLDRSADGAAALRFSIGCRVKCWFEGKWAAGTVTAQLYCDETMHPGVVAPYQVRLDEGRLIWAPKDDDGCILALGKKEFEEAGEAAGEEEAKKASEGEAEQEMEAASEASGDADDHNFRQPATDAEPPAPPSATSRVVAGLAIAHALVQALLPLRPLLISHFDALDAMHTKSHTLLSWRMMAVTTRNFVNVTLRSEALGATVHMTRTYNRLHLRRADGSLQLLPLTPQLEPRQAGYMPYTPAMLLHFARLEAARHGCHAAYGCSVVGDLWSAINGRPLQRFVKPTTDLATATIDEFARPAWVRPLLREFGTAEWRRRMAWLRARLADANYTVAFFADSPGGVFNESFPAMAPFPARVVLVPLQGRLAVDMAERTVELMPPTWSVDSQDALDFAPVSAPVGVPLGKSHAVRTLDGTNSCWAYVFGATN